MTRANLTNAELGAFLRARRERLRPADVGLTGDAGRRRTPGLRREEVALLSGVGVTWYTWLEQGRAVSASGQVIDALARALLLSPDEHAHLRLLAGLPAASAPPADGDPRPRLQHLVDSVAPSPAAVTDVHFDYVVWNRAYARLRHDPETLPAGRCNALWMLFTDADNRTRLRQWEASVRAVLSQFRIAAGQRPDDPRFRELIGALAEASPEFRAWWPEYSVRYFRPATIDLELPRGGLVSLHLFQLRLVDQPDLILVLQTPATAADLAAVTAELRGA